MNKEKRIDTFDEYPYETCDECGNRVSLIYSVRDEDWLKIQGNDAGTLCIGCFDRKAQSINLKYEFTFLEGILGWDGKIVPAKENNMRTKKQKKEFIVDQDKKIPVKHAKVKNIIVEKDEGIRVLKENRVYYGVVSNFINGSIWGIGKSEREAIKDATYWLSDNDPDFDPSDIVRGWNSNNYGDEVCLIEISEDLYTQIKRYGGDQKWEYDYDNMMGVTQAEMR